MKRLIILMLTVPLFCSCGETKKQVAYCFSVVFEKSDASVNTTLYCKTLSCPTSSEMMEITLSFDGKDFSSSLKKASETDYNIYFNSILAYYFDASLSDEDIYRIAEILLDNSKYATNNIVLLDAEQNTSALHLKAEDTCKNEAVRNSTASMYKDFLPALRALNVNKNYIGDKK